MSNSIKVFCLNAFLFFSLSMFGQTQSVARKFALELVNDPNYVVAYHSKTSNEKIEEIKSHIDSIFNHYKSNNQSIDIRVDNYFTTWKTDFDEELEVYIKTMMNLSFIVPGNAKNLIKMASPSVNDKGEPYLIVMLSGGFFPGNSNSSIVTKIRM